MFRCPSENSSIYIWSHGALLCMVGLNVILIASARGGTCRDYWGIIMGCFSRHIGSTLALCAELLAAVKAIKISESWLSPFMVRMDSSLVVRRCIQKHGYCAMAMEKSLVEFYFHDQANEFHGISCISREQYLH